ncbi:MAG: hypothetical protein LUG93_09275 [Lachnospiraceae bacterium]|nr:hypothetical protein [Lachnospiraceae bacterium]
MEDLGEETENGEEILSHLICLMNCMDHSERRSHIGMMADGCTAKNHFDISLNIQTQQESVENRYHTLCLNENLNGSG